METQRDFTRHSKFDSKLIYERLYSIQLSPLQSNSRVAELIESYCKNDCALKLRPLGRTENNVCKYEIYPAPKKTYTTGDCKELF